MGKFLLENATNLGKMNHSHFIWTSVLTPPLPSPPLLQTFIHLWQFYYNLCRWLEAQEPKRMLHGDGPKCWGVVECVMVFPPCTIWLSLHLGQSHLKRHTGQNKQDFFFFVLLQNASHYAGVHSTKMFDFKVWKKKQIKVSQATSLRKPELTPS